jgi:hypothetical protein
MARPIDDIADALRDAIIAALKDREKELTAIAEAGGDKAGHGIFGDVQTVTGIISDVIQAVPIVGQLLELPLEPLKAVEGAAGDAGKAFGLGYLLGYIGFQVMEPAIEPLQHAVADALQTGIFDPATAAKLASQGVLTRDQGASEAAGGNMDGTHFNQLVDSVDTRPGVSDLFEMYRRGVLSQEDMTTALARHGFPAFWYDKLQALVRNLLSPADLALAQLRGVIQPADAQAYAAELGMLAPDFDTLVLNTGEPPGAESLMEALRRQFIDGTEFEHGIRQSRIRDEWIPTMLKLRYSPMSTSDAVRAVVENYLTKDEGGVIAQQNGLTPEHWPILVESWGRPLSHEQMMLLYLRGEATLDEVHQAFRESDLKDKYIDQAVKLARRLIPERTIVSMLNHGIGSHDDAMQRLKSLGFNDTDASALIELGTAERKATHKALSKTDIVTLYEDSVMPKSDALARLEALGYSAQDAADELALADIKTKAAALRVVKAGAEVEVKAHQITQDQAVTRLTNAGLDHEQATATVAGWLRQRSTPTRTLSEAQVIRLATHSIILPAEAERRLVALGLPDADAHLLLESYVGKF